MRNIIIVTIIWSEFVSIFISFRLPDSIQYYTTEYRAAHEKHNKTSADRVYT